MRKKTLIDLYILKILEQHASEKKKMTQTKLIQYLEDEYGLEVSRRTLTEYIRTLRDENYIVGSRGIYKVNEFSDTELRLLIDGVLFGKHVPEEDAKLLISKLKSLSNENLKNRVKHIYYLKDIQHTDNTKLYNILDTIDEAIEKQKKVIITQCSYNIQGKLVECGTRIVSPYYIVSARSMYYLICYAGRNDDVENRRIDRISNVKILDEPRVLLSELPKYHGKSFDLAQYMKEHIYMFSGESEQVTLRVKKSAISDVIDWYGKGYRVVDECEEYVTIRIYVNTNAVYYWALQYGENIEVIKPKQLREHIKIGISEMLKKYEIEKF